MKPRCTVSRGVTLVELLVALGLASLLIAGLAHAVAQARTSQRASDAAARLQEQARLGLAVIGPDIEMAGYLGFARSEAAARFVRGGDPADVVAAGPALQQPLAAGAPPPGIPASLHACGTNFALDVATPVEGADGGFALGVDAAPACDSRGGGARALADTVTLRRAATATSRPEAGRLQLYSARTDVSAVPTLFADGHAPGPIDADHAVRDILVRAYYVARDAVGQPGLPALRVKQLTAIAGVPGFTDTEVLPGVEDLQIEFGIGAPDGERIDPARPGAAAATMPSGQITRYVPPGPAHGLTGRVVAVRVWLRLRADQPEAGYTDVRTYRYAGIVYEPAGPERRYRRLLVSRTFLVRNARRT